MFRLMLLLLIFCCFCYGGYILGEKFNKRHKTLQEILKSILLLQNEVVYNTTPLPEALFSIGAKCRMPLSELFTKVADLLLQGKRESVYHAFNSVYKNEKDKLYLNKEDERAISDFLKSLGELGVYGQEKMFNLVISNLNINIKEAELIANKNTKLYRYLGICIGAMVIIFLL
ncbi:stage III sporulation protein AB [Clostridium sardiniense]|uniref:stage III sporulation protein AB n=1 Tax=Clostridium sardiniense TaxID=29369 RepID=UPI001956B4A2|nr:stage III sporulation protein AB [Clostridium sardiniense]MBM7835846.1 stage III sporulation protein AB [Clostridium sardiniense]